MGRDHTRRRALLRACLGAATGALAGCWTGAPPTDVPAETSTGTTPSVTATTTPAPTLDLGAYYQLAPGFARTCAETHPAGDVYDGPTEEVVRRHEDQLRAAGVSRVLVRVDDRPDLERASQFAAAQQDPSITTEFRLGIADWLREGVPLDEQLQLVSDAIRDHPSYATRDGRPVVALRRLHALRYEQDPGRAAWEDLVAEHGSLQAVVDRLREGLTVDGHRPYLAGESRIFRHLLVRPRMAAAPRYERILSLLDGLRCLYAPRLPDHGPVQDVVLAQAKMDLRVAHQFAAREGLGFEPVVAPGLQDSRAGCPAGRQVARSATAFRELFGYAAQYAPAGRVVVDSFNDWRRGTQLEPGSMDGTDYGRSYLQVARSVATAEEFVATPERSVYHVAPEGSDLQPGSPAKPLGTIQAAIVRAGPGDTVRVHPGEYHEKLRTVRDGRPDAPITITGPREAVLKAPDGISVWLKNSHVRLTGLTIDGLLEPDRPGERGSYSEGVLVNGRPPDDRDDYLEDIVCAPAAIGNSDRSLMVFNRTRGLEVGPTRVIGLAGAEYLLDDRTSHVGEIVYLGTPPTQIMKDAYPWDRIDQTSDVRVHHIDNSAGHRHSELVNTKIGTHDVRVEYCTDGGGSTNTEPYPAAAVRFQSYDATLRWCDLRDGTGQGVFVDGVQRDWLTDRPDPPVSPSTIGTGHSVHGNRIGGFGEKAVALRRTTAGEQAMLCGNDVDGPADGDPEAACPASVPEGDGVGHLGGDSPF